MALSRLVQQFETQFTAVAYQIMEEEKQNSSAWNPVNSSGKIPPPSSLCVYCIVSHSYFDGLVDHVHVNLIKITKKTLTWDADEWICHYYAMMIFVFDVVNKISVICFVFLITCELL